MAELRGAEERRLAAQLSEAVAAGRPVVPVGGGTRLSWCRPEAREAEHLSMAPCTGILEYVPAEGTLTARAGTPWQELADAVHEGGHRLPARIPYSPGSTLGGVLASGVSGPDQFARQALRHHVLGCRALHSDGTVAQSGGRLVKNVTGFDVHKLHVGARGTLGVILEASLRLLPLPEEVAVLEAASADAAALLGWLHDLIRGGARLEQGTMTREGDEPWELVLGLAGRADQVRQDLEALSPPSSCEVRRSLGDVARERLHGTAQAGDESAFAYSAQGTRAAVRELLESAPAGQVWADPLTGRVLLTESPPSVRGLQVAQLGEGPTPGMGQPGNESGPREDWERRLQQALDPAGVFARGGAR